MQKSKNGPKADELEVSLFGPGFGECAVVHLGQGEWMVVDSCLSDDQSEPVALEYLRSLDVDIAKQVRLMVVSHWHDDHIKGASKVYLEAENARFACSAALRNHEFCEIMAASKQIKTVSRDKSANEMSLIFDELTKRRGRQNRTKAGPDHWATDGMTVFRRNSGGPQAEVVALSPSAQTITDAASRLGELLKSIKLGGRRFPRCSPNDQSIVLFIESDACSVLLGGDLECIGDPDRGWRAVVQSPLRPDVKSHAIKVAHHGSSNGDLDDIWSIMMHKDPPALMTPFVNGNVQLPTEEDIKRLKTRTNRLFCTCWPPVTRPPARSKPVERTLREMTLSHNAISRRVGHIRLRASLTQTSPIIVEGFNGATEL